MKRIILLVGLIVFGISSYTLAQVSIAPTTVFIDQNGIGSLFVTNSGDTPQEVNISFLFGYPGNDELGNLIMIYSDSTREKINGLGDRIRSFPRSFILAPQQQQTVRLQVRPDRSLADGTYFTRIKISSNAQTPDAGQANQNGVSTQVNFKFDQVIAAFQKVGEVTTNLEIGEITTEVKDQSIRIIHDFTVSGNSPYLGSVIATLKNSSGEKVAEQQQTVAMYYSGKKGIEINLSEKLSPGSYQIELTYESKRADIPSVDLIQTNPIKQVVSLVVQ